MQQLPAEAAKQIENMNVGDISEAFIMTDPAKNREVVAVVKLTNRIEGHRASLSEDYNMIKEMYEQSARDKLITEWIEKKIKDTYIRIEDGWDNCEFQYNGWKK
jgi:peptidyl-prolyl cis-trans isomerase SurA